MAETEENVAFRPSPAVQKEEQKEAKLLVEALLRQRLGDKDAHSHLQDVHGEVASPALLVKRDPPSQPVEADVLDLLRIFAIGGK